MKRVSIVILALLGLIKAKPADEFVKSLPGMADFDFGVYSGYVPIKGTTKNIHYLLDESQGNWETDPLIIWYNGGPGCSSMLGWAQEHGPYVMDDGATTFRKNDYSWNKEANMLYIEQPAGVGYSYCDWDNHREDCTFDDNSSGYDNLQVILEWFEKYPEYKNHELYISGESYGGIYVPFVVNQIHHHNVVNKKDPNTFKPNL
jgi:carboxypeptidase C (cathepsin A)